jgi:hypothetical protein
MLCLVCLSSHKAVGQFQNRKLRECREISLDIQMIHDMLSSISDLICVPIMRLRPYCWEPTINIKKQEINLFLYIQLT